MNKEVVIYTWRTCPFCVRAKRLLDDKGVPYTEVEISGQRQIYCESLTPTKYDAHSLLGLITDKWKFIQTTRPELYDLVHDKHESSNVIGEHPDIAENLGNHLKTTIETSLIAHDASSRIKLDRSDLERLQALGYITDSSVTEEYSFSANKDFL